MRLPGEEDPLEEEEYARRVEQERADRDTEKGGGEVFERCSPRPAPIVTNIERAPSAEQLVTAHLEMACLRCGAGMIRGTQCRRCGAWCR